MNWPASAIRLASVTLVSGTLLGLTTACEKANDLGLELPGTSPINSNYRDFAVTAYTVRQQPVETIKADHFLVGRVQDTKIGVTTAKSFLNLQLGMPSDSLPSKYTETKLDSVVLSLGFDQVYGTAAKPLRFDLLQLQQPLGERTVYNSQSEVATSGTLVSDFVGVLNRDRSIRQAIAGSTTDSSTVRVPDRVIRMRLLRYPQAAAFANSVFAALNEAGFDQARLDAVAKGVALLPTSNSQTQDNIVGFSRNYDTRLAFYFHGKASGKTVSIPHAYAVYFGNNPAKLPADAKFFTQLSTAFIQPLTALATPFQQVPASATGGETYLQEGVGLGTRIEFQGLDDLKNNGQLNIGLAELRIPIKQFTNGLFPYASNVYLQEVNATNQVLTRIVGATEYERLIQQEINSSGVVAPTAVGSPAAALLYPSYSEPQYYTVPLTSYLQSYLLNRLNGELPSGLILSPILRNNTSLTLNRTTLDASGIKLRVYFSQLK
ncbi:DUF4270 family protein [Hymenobacter taeanensis]|uniref:DUF4270 family protein n=1 Tax=Hymenobacter taeanensis TaxID=2735321 RepID=A0A6M6BFV4_9BACT|nr:MULTISPECIES: DUF4270 family protein [Hymenobacter]QJX46842.1 DUF4270 family protein [Hymenobacter taeanensis]UOQ80714.1 DUF4270 domain-containing protein [Hymenobacter sp. 5414T-23]